MIIKIVIPLLFVLVPFFCEAQKKVTSDSIKFIFTKNIIVSPDDLNLCIVYTNQSEKPTLIYKELSEGNTGDRFYNIYIECEKKTSKTYKPITLRYYQSKNQFDVTLRHFDLPKKELCPHCSDTLVYNLSDPVHGFNPGEYRFKAHLRVKTISNNTIYTDTTGAVQFPYDELKYITSKWFYFKVEKEIAVPPSKQVE